jgi:hypothetical protein
VPLPSTPPSGQSPVIRKGDAGWPTYALQKHLSFVGVMVFADGAFGPLTEDAVKAFQGRHGLVVDGVAGPATQSKAVVLACGVVDASVPALPSGLLRGLLLSEGGLLLAPVNWAVAGGVDCGPAWRSTPRRSSSPLPLSSSAARRS